MAVLERILLAALFILLAAGAARGAEIQIRTNDGQTIQGEHLGTRDGLVKLRTSYGVLSIPENRIVAITAVKLAERGNAGGGNEAVKAASFPEVKAPALPSLVARRLAGQSPPRYRNDERQELHRLIRNFADSSDASRRKIIARLQEYGAAADPFIDGAYNQIDEVPEKVELLQSAAAPGRAASVLLFVHAHDAAMRYMQRVADEPPALPPDYLSKRDRESPRGKADFMALAAGHVLAVEGYAATAGGPLNALFLLDIYRERYTAETEDPLLTDIGRDKSRLAAAAADALKSRSTWSGEDRAMIAEQVLPWLFRDSDDLKALARELLKKILPSGYPKWSALEEDWVEWWGKARPELNTAK